MTDPEARPAPARARFRRTLTQVMIVQGVALVLLALLQIVYGV
jgi:hypothetical protein